MAFLTISFQNLKIVRKGLENLKKEIPEVARQRIWYFAVGIRKAMKQPGTKPQYPIQWDSTKQRKAFFATDGFGRGIPTKRSGEYVQAWRAIKVENGYEISNPLAHAKFITGTSGSSRPQSRIHRGRWRVFFFEIQKAIRTLPKEVRQKLDQTIRKEGFKTK